MRRNPRTPQTPTSSRSPTVAPVSPADLSSVTPGAPTQPTQDFFEPIQSIRTFEAAIQNIVAGIERARLRQGDRLPNESELAQQLGISKPTLRQALRVLERSGLLLVKQGKAGGIFLNSDYLPVDEISTNIETEEHAVLEALHARRLIESAVTAEALTLATNDDLVEIRRTVELLEAPGLGMDDVIRADMMFHRAVVRAAHNRVLEDAMRVVYRAIASLRGAAGDPSGVHEIHSRQLLAMEARDPAALAEALEIHFRYLETLFATFLNRSWEDMFGHKSPAHTSAHQQPRVPKRKPRAASTR